MSASLTQVLCAALLAWAPLSCAGSAANPKQSAVDEVAGAAGATAGAAGNDGAQTSNGIPVCESPRFDALSQLVVCANGFSHRAQPSNCGSEASAGAQGSSAESGYGAPCDDDAECAAGTACVCDALAYLDDPALVTPGKGACVLATCRTDADCGAGSYCALGNLNYLGEAVRGFGCLREDDECSVDADCNSADGYICLERIKRTCSLPPQ